MKVGELYSTGDEIVRIIGKDYSDWYVATGWKYECVAGKNLGKAFCMPKSLIERYAYKITEDDLEEFKAKSL
jgi:hypothetical protein